MLRILGIFLEIQLSYGKLPTETWWERWVYYHQVFKNKLKLETTHAFLISMFGKLLKKKTKRGRFLECKN